MGPDGRVIPHQQKSNLILHRCHWKNNEIVEDKLFYDLVGLAEAARAPRRVPKIQAEKCPCDLAEAFSPSRPSARSTPYFLEKSLFFGLIQSFD